ncbi:MAG: transglutaminase-like domain-containing protein [Bacteroidota bacterium]
MTENRYSDERLRAMVSLLDDPDPEIYRRVQQDLDALGVHAVAQLEELWIQTEEVKKRRSLEKVIHRLQWNDIQCHLTAWLEGDRSDLLSALCIIARYQYPNLDEQAVRQTLQAIRIEVWMGLNEQMTALEQVRHLNFVLFRVHKFRGNTDEYLNPNNNFINKVLETRKGNPLMVGLVYMLIAQKLDLPIYGVNLPQHFVLAYLEQGSYSGQNKSEDFQQGSYRRPLFYINAFNMGSVFGKRDVDQFLKMVQVEPKDQFYRACTNTEILLRLCANLESSYRDAEEFHKISEIQALQKLIKDNE